MKYEKEIQHLDLFSGIGGFALATEMVWPKVSHTFCDIEPFARAVLKKHWPEATIHGDIRTLTNAKRNGLQEPRPQQQTVGHRQSNENAGTDLLTGGFPCQPFSQAGRRLGTEDDRHLWPEMLRVVREFHPRWVVGENVGGFVTWNDGMVLEQVHADLEGEGYEVQAFIIPAVSVNAPHRRDRVWIVAHSKDGGSGGRSTDGCQVQTGELLSGEQNNGSAVRNKIKGRTQHDKSTPYSEREGRAWLEGQSEGQYRPSGRAGGQEGTGWNANWLEVATRLCTLDDGLPGGLARPRGWRNAALKGAGNAIVPQVAAEIFRAIRLVDEAV